MNDEEIRIRVRALLEAVGHIGVDFGYGQYTLSPNQIIEAQDLFTELGVKDE